MDIPVHVRHLSEQGSALADAAERAGLDTAVPTCPDWTVRDLVRHTGGVHRWATSYLATGRTRPHTPAAEDAFFAAPTDPGLIAWFRAGHRALIDAIEAADPALECAAFFKAPSPLAFWARRQAHETAVHRTDAELAGGAALDPTALDPAFAADGIDELFDGFFARRPRSGSPLEQISLAVRATDADCAWTATFTAEGRQSVHGVHPAECTVTASAAELYLLLWNRLGSQGMDVVGDSAVLDRWKAKQKIALG